MISTFTRIFLLLAVAVTVYSCCRGNGVELERYNLSQGIRDSIPYQINQVVHAVHNNGYEFEMSTQAQTYYDTDQEECEDYHSYENYTVALSSKLPLLNIEVGAYAMSYFSEQPDNWYLMVNRNYWTLSEMTPEPMEVNQVYYPNVYVCEAVYEQEGVARVYYTTAEGLLKIEYTNGDYIQIIN